MEQSFRGDSRLRTKCHLRNKSRRDNTGRGSARESTSTTTSAKRDADLEVEATLTGRELHKRESLSKLRSDLVTNW